MDLNTLMVKGFSIDNISSDCIGSVKKFMKRQTNKQTFMILYLYIVNTCKVDVYEKKRINHFLFRWFVETEVLLHFHHLMRCKHAEPGGRGS